MDKKKKIPYLKGDEEFTREFAESFNKETDRGAAILAATILDDSLQLLLRKSVLAVHENETKRLKLIDGLFESRGSLDSFSSKIDFAFIIGAIDKNTRDALHIVRDIRNHFAHHHNGSFDEDRTLSRIQSIGQLLFPKVEITDKAGFLTKLGYVIHRMAEDEKAKGSREFFDYCVASIQSGLVREIEDLDIQFDVWSNSIFEKLKRKTP